MTREVSVAFLQIYMEKLVDLLAPGAGAGRGLQLREDPKHGVFCAGLTHARVTSPAQVRRAPRRQADGALRRSPWGLEEAGLACCRVLRCDDTHGCSQRCVQQS